MTETPENKTDALMDQLKSLASELTDMPPIQVGIGETMHSCLIALTAKHEDGSDLGDDEVEVHSHYIVGLKMPAGDMVLGLFHDLEIAKMFAAFMASQMSLSQDLIKSLTETPASNQNGEGN